VSRQDADWFGQQVEALQDDPEFIAERLLIELNEQVCVLMEQGGVTRAKLAERLGCSRAYVSKLLNGVSNVSLLTLVRLAQALDGEIEVRVRHTEKAETALPQAARMSAPS